MSRGRLFYSRRIVLALGVGLLSTAMMAPPAYASAEGASTGSLALSITAPAALPPGFELNPGGTIPGNFAFPDADNTGSGSFAGLGSASCSPTGCTAPAPGVNLQYLLTNDLTCTANPAGRYGGLEDSFALFGARNMTGASVTLGLRFTSSWEVSATAGSPGQDSAAASVDLLWAVPTDFCIELTNCPTGSLSGGTAAGCPSGFVTGTTLVLGTDEADTGMGNAMSTGPMSNCDVTVVVLSNASSGGDLSVTSSCLASSRTEIFSDGFESGDASAWTRTSSP